MRTKNVWSLRKYLIIAPFQNKQKIPLCFQGHCSFKRFMIKYIIILMMANLFEMAVFINEKNSSIQNFSENLVGTVTQQLPKRFFIDNISIK